MGLVKEETKYRHLKGVQITVIEREKCEQPYHGRICLLEMSFEGSGYTPNQLIELGKWLVNEGRRINNTYTRSGKPTIL